MIAVFCGVFGAAALAYDTSFDAVYTAETGYVTLEGNDTGNGVNSSFHSAKNWSDLNFLGGNEFSHDSTSGFRYVIGDTFPDIKKGADHIIPSKSVIQ